MQRAILRIGALVCFFGTSRASAALIIDGGFESASPPAIGFTQSVPGWSVSGDTLVGVTSESVAGITAHSGSNWASLSEFSSSMFGSFTQTITTTTPGAEYDLSYFYTAGSGSGTANEFKVLWNGNTLIDIVNGPAIGWTRYDFVIPGTGNDTLQFKGFNGPSFNGLDDVSLDPVRATVPEPASITIFGLMGSFGLFAGARRRRPRLGGIALPNS